MKHTRKSRRSCQLCQQRPAKFAYRGHVKRDRQHVLCFACFRALTDSHRLAHPHHFNLNLATARLRQHADAVAEVAAPAADLSSRPIPETA
jgi:hypothetical protein